MKHEKKIILGGLIGNLVEAYDVAICGFMAFYLSKYIIGDGEQGVGIVFGLFFIAYIARPLGAFILGMLSDIYGRKNVLMGSIVVMGLATTAIGLLPTNQSIGLLAAFALLVLRIIQSIACGSEFLNSVSFLVESGQDKGKGFRACFTSFGIMSGMLIASLTTELLFSRMTPDNEYWVWRLPFLFAGIGTLAGLYVRMNIPESLQYILYYSNKPKPKAHEIITQSMKLFKHHPFLFNYAFVTSFLSVASTFLFYVYVPIHAQLHSTFSKSQIFLSNTCSLLLILALIPLFGRLLDKVDRLKMIQFATAGFLVLVYPFIYALNFGNYPVFFMMQLLVTIPAACYYVVSSVLLTDIFPIQVRCTTLSITYSIAASLGAGLIPMISMYLVNKTHILTSPSWIVVAVAAIAMLNFVYLHKKYRQQKNQYHSLKLVEELS